MILGDYLNLSLWVFGYLITFETVLLFLCSFMHYNNDEYQTIEENYLVSILVPCYNESKTLENCVSGILVQEYTNYEVIIIDDGSTDDTLEVANCLAEQSSKIKVFTKKNGGKASALNYGIEKASGDILISLDADSIFLKNTLNKIVSPFDDKELSAACGNIKISNRDTFIGRYQSLEYIAGLNLHRRAFAHLGCVQVISGALGAFKKDALIDAGGYPEDTMVEDMDVTINLVKKGYKVQYIGDAVAYTEAPESIKNFYKQRYRWVYGSFQILNKHKDVLFRYKKYGYLGLIGLPYYVYSTIIVLIISTGAIMALLYMAYTNTFFNSFTFLIQALGIQLAIFCYTILMDNENKKLFLSVPGFLLIYKPLLHMILIKVLVDYLIGKKAKWNKLERLGKNTIQTT